MEGGGGLWLLLTVGGVIVLGLAILYSMRKNRETTPKQHEVAERGTERLYSEEQRDPAN